MQIQYLARKGLPRLAYVYSPATENGIQFPLVAFLGGYRSDMSGTKATFLEQRCRARGQAFLRFDYSGHGQSEGRFEDGTIGSWKQDALDMLRHIADGPVVLAGSSMGGWMALLVALELENVRGLVGIAAAPDFTEEIYRRLPASLKETLKKTGAVAVPNHYGAEPYHFTKAFYEEAKQHLLLNCVHRIDFPMRLIQGMKDEDVPWQTAVEIQKHFQGADVDIVFIADGEHRLSRRGDLEILDREICNVCKGLQ